MSRINYARVLIGGLVAGLVVNVGETVLNRFVVAEQSQAAMERLGLAPQTGAAMALYLFMGFAMGILIVWLYAAIRPRFGPGPGAATMAGIAGWALFSGLGTLNFLAMGAWPATLLIISLVWGLFEFILAALLGSRFYSEAEAAA
jgi:hypothetical protein